MTEMSIQRDLAHKHDSFENIKHMCSCFVTCSYAPMCTHVCSSAHCMHAPAHSTAHYVCAHVRCPARFWLFIFKVIFGSQIWPYLWTCPLLRSYLDPKYDLKKEQWKLNVWTNDCANRMRIWTRKCTCNCAHTCPMFHTHVYCEIMWSES